MFSINKKNIPIHLLKYFKPKYIIKPKDDIGIPWLASCALRDFGFYLRSEIIWNKSNAMPESVKDRPTKSHEQIFLLTKNSKYFYDYESILEIATGYDGKKDMLMKGGVKYKDFNQQTMLSRGHERWKFKNLQDKGLTSHSMHEKRLMGEEYMSPVRNKRTVWDVPTKPYHDAHFATFNEDLITPPIQATASQYGVCDECGGPYDENGKTCKCIQSYPIPAVVLDTFMGSGTTGVVAKKLGRSYIGIDLNKDYIEIAEKRISETKDEFNIEKEKTEKIEGFFE